MENTMQEQRFGMELEFTGITRSKAAKVIAEYLGSVSQYVGSGYDTYEVKTADGRRWKVMSDASIHPENEEGGSATNEYKCEFVTPICTYEDIPAIQEIISQLRHAKARVNESCGIHVHIDASTHNAKSLKNLANIMASKETLLFEALAVNRERAEKWCKKVDQRLVEEIHKKKPHDMAKIKDIWYNGNDESYMHYSSTRYHALNLHAVWQKGTVEFRMFNSTLHAGQVKSYIQLCLAISYQAKKQKGTASRETVSTNHKYTFRTWLLRLGMIGDEFKTARGFLLGNLSGDIAWHDKENRRTA